MALPHRTESGAGHHCSEVGERGECVFFGRRLHSLPLHPLPCKDAALSADRGPLRDWRFQEKSVSASLCQQSQFRANCLYS